MILNYLPKDRGQGLIFMPEGNKLHGDTGLQTVLGDTRKTVSADSTEKTVKEIKEMAETNNQNQQTNQEPNQQQNQNQQQVPKIDYGRIEQILEGKQAATEESVLRGYFKQQGLSKEEAEQAIAAFKQQKAASQPNVEAIQQQAETALRQAQNAMIERDAMILSAELGLDLKTIPYILKMADITQVIGENGNVDQEKLKEALNKVLEDIPQLKLQLDNQQSGFRQIGAGQTPGQQPGVAQQSQKTVPAKRWNRFNN